MDAADVVSRRVSSLVSSGVLTRCMRTLCMPDTLHASQAQDGEAFRVLLCEAPKVMQPSFESNMQRPFVDQPTKLSILTVPSFMKMLSDMQIRGVCEEGCKEKHFGRQCCICGTEYSEHNGHTCPDGGQGYFEVDRPPHLLDTKRILFALAGRVFSGPRSESVDLYKQSIEQVPLSSVQVEMGASPGIPEMTKEEFEILQKAGLISKDEKFKPPLESAMPGRVSVGESSILATDSSGTAAATSQAQTSASAQAQDTAPKSTSDHASAMSSKTAATSSTVITSATDGVDQEDSAAVVKASNLSAKRRRFMLAQGAVHQQMHDSNKQYSYKLTGDIHGVDCKQFSCFFRVLNDFVESQERSNETQIVREIKGRASQGSGSISRLRALKEIQHHQRKNNAILNHMVMEDLTKVRYWFPCSWDRASRFFKYELTNPYSCDVEIIVSVSGQHMEVVTNAEDHAHCCHVFFLSSASDKAPMPQRVQHIESEEKGLIPYRAAEQANTADFSRPDLRRYRLTIVKAHTISIFFMYTGVPGVGLPVVPWQLPVAFGPSLETTIRAAQTPYWTRSKVSFHRRENLMEILQLEIRPQPLVPARTFRIYLGQGEITSGLLPLERHEVGHFVKVFSQSAGPLLINADVMSKAKCEASKSDRILSFAFVDSGAWLIHTTSNNEVRHGALHLHLDASACTENYNQDISIFILDGLSNLVTVWSLHIVVLKTMTLTDNVAKHVRITAQEFGKDLQLDLPSDPRHCQCLVSRSSGVDDGVRADILQIVDSTLFDAKGVIAFNLKDNPIHQARQCQIRLIDRRSGICYRSLRVLQTADSSVTHIPSLILDAEEEYAQKEDNVLDQILELSSSDEEDVDDNYGSEEDSESQGDADICFYLIVDPEWMRLSKTKEAQKKTEMKIRINASEVLREDLQLIQELKRVMGKDEQVLPPIWKDVRKTLKDLTGQRSFAYVGRPGDATSSKISVKNERFLSFLLLSFDICLDKEICRRGTALQRVYLVYKHIDRTRENQYV